MNHPFLEYPKYFSTLYQNSEFDFPHDTILNLSYDEIVNLFLDKDYVIPYYIKLHNPNINNIDKILLILENNEYFCLLGALFMYLKGLLENLDQNTNIDGINIIEDADKNIIYKSKELQNYVNNFNDYFLNHTTYDFIIMISLIIDVTQNIIINVVNYVTDHRHFPLWFRNKIIINFINHIPQLFEKKMKYYKGLPKTYTRYLGEIIPNLIDLYDKAELFQYY